VLDVNVFELAWLRSLHDAFPEPASVDALNGFFEQQLASLVAAGMCTVKKASDTAPEETKSK